MRAATIQIIFFIFFTAGGISYATDLVPFEKTCAELGFKRKTPAYGDCVLELFEREKSGRHNAALEEKKLKELEAKTRADEVTQKAVVAGDGTPEHQTCSRYGFIPETSLYAECRQKIDAAKADARLAQTRYEADLRRYEEQVAKASRQKESDRNIRLMEMGLGVMGGGSRSASTTQNIGPAPTPPVLNQRIFLPGGQVITCRPSQGTNIYCY